MAIVTGSTNGIGLCTAEALARAGATVIMACRNVAKGEQVAAAMQAKGKLSLRVMELDLGSLQSVRRFADAFLALDSPLHLLVNNAGVVNTSYRESKDGLEEMLAVNHLGHFYLTLLLLPKLCQSPPARIVNVASLAHKMAAPLDLGGLAAPVPIEGMKSAFAIYGRSKLCNILFSLELADRLSGSAVTSNALHPGTVSTGLGLDGASPLFKYAVWPFRAFMKSPESGAQTSIYCATSPAVAAVSGRYFDNCAEIAPAPAGQDRALAKELWDVSCAIIADKLKEDLSWAKTWRWAPAAH